MQARQSQLYTVTMRGSLPCDTEILLPQSLALEFGCDSYVVCKQNCACAFIPKYVCMSLPSLLIRTSLNGNDGQKLLAVLWAMSKKKKTKKNPSLVPTVDLAFPCFLCLPLNLSIHVFVLWPAKPAREMDMQIFWLRQWHSGRPGGSGLRSTHPY